VDSSDGGRRTVICVRQGGISSLHLHCYRLMGNMNEPEEYQSNQTILHEPHDGVVPLMQSKYLGTLVYVTHSLTPCRCQPHG
jgi:hypothetical protein